MPANDAESTLPDAVDALYRAVGELVDPIKRLVGGTVLAGPSPYEDLLAEIPASTAGDSSRGVAKSRPVVWVDALDLRIEIDTRTAQLHPEGQDTPQRLRGLAAKRWRPQDTRIVRDAATEIAAWRVSIRALTDPQHVKQIAAPCPACGTRWVYRTSASAGETIRQPALQLITDTGCTCQNCRSFWPPDRYLFLCKLLGFAAPAGVIN